MEIHELFFALHAGNRIRAQSAPGGDPLLLEGTDHGQRVRVPGCFFRLAKRVETFLFESCLNDGMDEIGPFAVAFAEPFVQQIVKTFHLRSCLAECAFEVIVAQGARIFRRIPDQPCQNPCGDAVGVPLRFHCMVAELSFTVRRQLRIYADSAQPFQIPQIVDDFLFYAGSSADFREAAGVGPVVFIEQEPSRKTL